MNKKIIFVSSIKQEVELSLKNLTSEVYKKILES